MSEKYRLGSRKQRVWEVFEIEGADKASEFGLGLGLALGTLKSWIGGWGGKVTGQSEKKVTVSSKKLIIVSWAPNDEAYLIKHGTEVSQIYRPRAGIDPEYVSNDQWKFKEDSP